MAGLEKQLRESWAELEVAQVGARARADMAAEERLLQDRLQHQLDGAGAGGRAVVSAVVAGQAVLPAAREAQPRSNQEIEADALRVYSKLSSNSVEFQNWETADASLAVARSQLEGQIVRLEAEAWQDGLPPRAGGGAGGSRFELELAAADKTYQVWGSAHAAPAILPVPRPMFVR